MKIILRGVVEGQRLVGDKHLIQVTIKMQSTNEDLQLGPVIPDFAVYVTATPEQAAKFPASIVIDGELTWRLPREKP